MAIEPQAHMNAPAHGQRAMPQASESVSNDGQRVEPQANESLLSRWPTGRATGQQAVPALTRRLIEPAPTPTGAAARATHRARALPRRGGSESHRANENVLSRWPTDGQRVEPQANERGQPLQGGLEPAPTPTGAARARATHGARALPLKDGCRSPRTQQAYQQLATATAQRTRRPTRMC